MSIWKQWGTSVLLHFLPFSCLSFPSPLPSRHSLHVKSARTWCLVKGMDTVHRPWAICSPWLKGSVNIFLAKYWYQFNERCHLVAYLSQNCVCVCTFQYLCMSSHKTGPWAMTVPTHLISSTSTLLSLQFYHSNDCLYVCVCLVVFVCGQAGGYMCISVCLCDSVYVFMHKTCWCVWFCSSKMTRWPDCYQM